MLHGALSHPHRFRHAAFLYLLHYRLVLPAPDATIAASVHWSSSHTAEANAAPVDTNLDATPICGEAMNNSLLCGSHYDNHGAGKYSCLAR